MFEQANIDAAGRTSKPWTVSLSTFLQVAGVSAALLYPLLRIEAMPPVKLAMPSLRARAVQLVETPPQAQPAPRAVVVRRGALLFPTPNATRPVATDTEVFATDLPPGLDPAPGNTTLLAGPPCFSNCGAGPQIPAAPPVKPVPTVKPTPVTPPPTGPVRVGGAVLPPLLISYVKPVYPPLARQARIQGTVRIEAVISKDGAVRAAHVISGHPLLVGAAIDAVRQWRYRPTLLNREPVEVALSLDVNFTLSQ